MSFQIVSPANSFVDFNPPTVINCLEQPDISLPAYNDFAIRFQFQVQGDLPAANQLKVIIADAEGNKLLDQNVFVQNLCYRYQLKNPITHYPVIIGNGQPIPAGFYTYERLVAAINAILGFTMPSASFDYCCLFPSITISTIFGNVTFSGYWTRGFVDFPATKMTSLLQVNDCFRYAIADANGNILAISNKFRRVADTCFSTLLSYWNDEDDFGFAYPTSNFNNTVRLPFTFHKPIYPVIEQIYRKSNGGIFRASSRINKEFEGYTDVLTDYYHQRLIVALKHDHVQFTNSDVGLIAQELFVEGDYKPEWPDDNTIVVAPAKFKISVPISNINSNCYNDQAIPCCPPYLVSVTSTDTTITVTVNFGIFVNSWNLRWKRPDVDQWTEIDGILTKSYTIQNLGPGQAIEFQLESVCGSTLGSWSSSYGINTTGSSPVTCTGDVTGITFTQTSTNSGTLKWAVTGSANTWVVVIDNQAPQTVGTNSLTVGTGIGDHTVKITPVCQNGASSTPRNFGFTMAPPPSYTQISSRTDVIDKLTVQEFQPGGTISAGNVFTNCLGYCVTVVAIAGDTPQSIATKMVNAINATTLAQWNSGGSNIAGGTPGWPPTAQVINGNIVQTRCPWDHQMSGAVTIS